MFEISLTTTRENAEKDLQAFKNSVPQFNVTEFKQRNENGNRCYIYLRLQENGKQLRVLRGGRPRKLTNDTVAEIQERLRSDSECNKTHLAAEYGISYGLLLRIEKGKY